MMKSKKTKSKKTKSKKADNREAESKKAENKKTKSNMHSRQVKHHQRRLVRTDYGIFHQKKVIPMNMRKFLKALGASNENLKRHNNNNNNLWEDWNWSRHNISGAGTKGKKTRKKRKNRKKRVKRRKTSKKR